MADVIFYEKPGCGGNARQKAVLERSGHRLDVRDLLATPWTAETLRPFFGARPVADWFNAAAPRVKSGEVAPATLDADAALALMVADPLLIRRPLLQSDGRREVGFEPARIAAWIGLADTGGTVGEACVRPDGAAGCATPAERSAASPARPATTAT